MNSKIPLYLQVADSIKKDIMTHVFPVGSFIPTETALENTYQVSKITVRKAIEILAAEGYVQKKSGKGTTVLSDKLFNKLSKAVSFSAMLEQAGHQLTKKVISVEQVTFTTDQVDLIKAFGKQAICITRLYYLDDQPYIHFKHYVRLTPDKNSLQAIDVQSLYNWLHLHGQTVNSFNDRFGLAETTPTVKKLLNTTAPMLLKRERRSFALNGDVLEVSIGLYNTALREYSIDYEI